MQVPKYSSVPGAAPQQIGTPNVHVDAPADAFGVGIAQAFQGLGKEVSHVGDEIFQRAVALQNLQNETEAKEADAAYMMKAGELHANFNALEGKDAVEAYPAYMESLNKVRQDIRGGMKNDASRRMYDSSSLSVMSRTVFNGAGYAAGQQKRAAAGASSARVDALGDQVILSPDDEVAFQQITRGVASEIQSQADLHGWDPAQTQQETQKAIGKLWANRIVSKAKTDPYTAEKWMQQNKASLGLENYSRVEGIVMNQQRTTGARMISQQVNADLRTDPDGEGKSLADRIAEGDKLAEKQSPGDPLFKDYVKQRIEADYAKSKSIKRDFDQTNINTISSALMGNFSNGKMPTTVEELTADPKAKASWDALDSKTQRSFLSALKSNAKGDIAWTNQNHGRYQQLKGMAQSDPLEFMGQNVGDEKMPFSARRELINLQIKLKDKAEGDPRVSHALQVLRPMTVAAGLDPSKDKDGYYQFVGSLQDALDSFQKDNKKLPDAAQINEIGSRLLQQQADPEKWGFGIFNRTTSTYQLSVPEAVSNRIKLDPFWAEKGITPTDADIQRIYVREQYNKLYGGKKVEGRPGAPK